MYSRTCRGSLRSLVWRWDGGCPSPAPLEQHNARSSIVGLMEAIKLQKPQWETIAVQVATGKLGSHAYASAYPDCSTPASSYCRLTRRHPEIIERIEQVRGRCEDEAVARVAQTKDSVERSLLENIEHAKNYGKVIRDRNGVVITCERNHAAINQALKIIADINGLMPKSNARKGRDEDTPEAELTAKQILANIKRLYKQTNGAELDEDALGALELAANASGSPVAIGTPAIESA